MPALPAEGVRVGRERSGEEGERGGFSGWLPVAGLVGAEAAVSEMQAIIRVRA